MKQRIALVLVVLAVVAGLWWIVGRRPASDDASPDEPTVEAGLDRDALLDRKRRARSAGAIDLSPAKAFGRITDAQTTQPVPGAVVLLTPKGLDQLARAIDPGESSRPLQARSDAQGYFELPRVAPGRYALSATGAGYLPRTRIDVTIVAGRDNSGLDLALLRGGHEVRGTVSDIGGGPVEDVLVRVTRLDEGSPFNFDRPGLGTVTDEDGRFAIQLPDGLYQLGTYHPDYVDARESLVVDGGPRALALRIIPAGSIEGRVLARDSGKPIAGAIVSRNEEQLGGWLVQGVGESQVTTDDEGRFRLRGLGSGVVRLTAVAPGYATRQPVEVVLGVAEQLDDVEVLVDPALTVSGFVVARGDEERGLEGVLVGAFSVDPPRLYVASAPSAADGYFEIFGVLPGAYTVGAVGEDSLPNVLGASAQVRDADVTDVLVIMDTGVHVTGVVRPPGPATISVEVDASSVSIGTMMESMGNAVVTARTDEQGRFDLHPVASGALTVVAEGDDGSRGSVSIEVGRDDVAGLSIDLRPRASVRGRVTDASGQPGAGLQVALWPDRAGAPGGTTTRLGALRVPGRTATTDDDGNFVAKGLDADEYSLSVMTPKGQVLQWATPADPAQPTAPLRLSLADAEAREGVALVVEARDGVIAGVVVGPEGEPVMDAWVTAVRDDSLRDLVAPSPGPDAEPIEANLRQWELLGLSEPPVLTDDQGRFEVPGLRSGRYRLRAEASKDGARGFVDDVGVGETVRIDLRALAGLEGVVEHDGGPVRQYTLEVRGRGRRIQQVYAADGRFTMERLDAGDYEVIASSAHGTARAEVAIVEGATASVQLEIGGWGTLRGVVVDAGTGDPIEGLSITVIGDGGRSASSMVGMLSGEGPKTDAQGRFSVGEVPPGEGRIMFVDRDATGLGGVVAQADYVIEAEEDHDLGTIAGVAPSYLRPEDRGSVGLQVTVATYARRPRAPAAVDDPEQAAFDLTSRLWVNYVAPDGPAARQGVVPGDEVIAVDESSVREIGAVNAAKLLSPVHLKVGEGVELEIEHDGQRRRFSLVAGPGAR